MSDVSGGDGWWQASDSKWYPPESHPDAAAPVAPAPTVAPAEAAPQQTRSAAHAPAEPSLVLPDRVTISSPGIRLASFLLDGLLIVVTLGIGWLIWASFTAGVGQTPAKRMLHLRVIGVDTMRPVGMGRMFWMRGLVAGLVMQIVVPLTLGIILFMPFWDKRNQNLWDKISTCYVVVDEFDAWGTKPDVRT